MIAFGTAVVAGLVSALAGYWRLMYPLLTDMPEPQSPFKAIVLGGSGAAGSALVRALVAAPDVSEITLVLRSKVAEFENIPKLQQQIVADPATQQHDDLHVGHDIAFMLAGAGKARLLSRAAFEANDVGLARTFGQSAKSAGISHFIALSAIMADSSTPDSGEVIYGGSGTYNQVKGMAEDALVGLNFAGALRIYRPAFMLGTPHTPQWVVALSPFLNPLLPPKFRSSSMEQIAQGMLAEARIAWNSAVEPSTHVLHVPDYTGAVSGTRV